MNFTVENDAHVFDQIDNNYTAHVNDINCHNYAPVELKQFAEMWKKALDKARKTRDYAPLARYMTDDFKYTWCLPGVDPTYFHKRLEANGKDEVVNTVHIDTMIGVEGWDYPWIETYIDPRKGVIFYMWKEVTPYRKKDGTLFENQAFAVTRLDYAGGYKVKVMEDLVDCEFHIALVDETIAAGFAPESLIQKQNEYYRQLAKDYNAFYRHLEELCSQAGNDKSMIPDLLDGYYSPYKNAVVKGVEPELETVDAYPVSETAVPADSKALVSNQLEREIEPSAVHLSEICTQPELSIQDAKAFGEHMTVRNHVGYYDFTHKLLEVTGLDARSFLSRMFVGPVAKAKIGQGKYTTMLNEDGQIIDDVIVFRIEEDKYWISTLYIEELIAWFNAHKTYEEVYYSEITGITFMYAVQGPASRAVLNGFLKESVTELKQFQICNNSIGEIPVKVARSGFTGELGYEIYCKPEDRELVKDALEREGQRYGITEITTDVIINSLPREKGYVLMSDIGGLNPMECGLGWSIDWTKNFIGKTALEKVNVQGAKKELLGFAVNDDSAVINAGAEVFVNNEYAGRVTVFTYGFSLKKNIGYAVVNVCTANIGDFAVIVSEGKRYEAVLRDRVFYDPKNDRIKERNIAELEKAALNPYASLRKNDSSAKRDHESVRNAVGYYDFTHKLLEVTGLDARSFLSKMFVGAVAKAKVNQAKYTTMLNESGQIIDDVIVFRMDEDKYWVSTLYIEKLIVWFDAHKNYEEVSYREITEDITMYAVQGPCARRLLNDIVKEPIDSLRNFFINDNTLAGAAVKIARSGFTGELGYEIYCNPRDADLVEKELKEKGKKYHAVKIATDVITTSLPREKGFVLMSDIGGCSPLECGLGWSIDWNKNFIGKAALQKEQMQGSRRELLGFVVEDDSAEITEGAEAKIGSKTVGKVTMFTYGFTIQKNIGFVLICKEDAKIGDKILINGIPAILTDRIWYDQNNSRIRS
ncbi:aminomethyltransferase family protein [Lactonifactor longoviformis]|uniref:Glycine cleavage system T protein (Aminomethyltransferase) n=1 Tax=Lactonifactor longoviformis DSM 17459 TaxID=1122155 RepID=A0A1M4ZXJ1_9CLOT|nr:aminomethyltransferase family protein [Lactonifactor longoviformis]SHF22684.1 Glycine cleavage system T protein (aminomethyltransferase) [Lactonifactor longoviformis DSM 17459]